MPVLVGLQAVRLASIFITGDNYGDNSQKWLVKTYLKAL
jgi:hypothetical protein